MNTNKKIVVIAPLFLALIFCFISATPAQAQRFRPGNRPVIQDRPALKQGLQQGMQLLQQELNKAGSQGADNGQSDPSQPDRPVLNALRGLVTDQVTNFTMQPQVPLDQMQAAYVLSLDNLNDLDATLKRIAEGTDTTELYAEIKSDSEMTQYDFLDQSRPSGFVMLTDGANYFPLVFMPLNIGQDATSEKTVAYKFLGKFGREIAPNQVAVHEENGIRWTPLGENPFVKLPADSVVVQKGKWGYMIPRNLIDVLPNDPTIYLPKLDIPQMPQTDDQQTDVAQMPFRPNHGKYIISDYINMTGLVRTLGNGLLTIGEIVNAFSDPKKAKLGVEQKEVVAGAIAYGRMLVNESYTLFRGVKSNDATGEITLETVLWVAPGGQLSKYFQRQMNRQCTVRSFYKPRGAVFAGIASDELLEPQKRAAHAFTRYLFNDIEQKTMQKQAERREGKKANSDGKETESDTQTQNGVANAAVGSDANKNPSAYKNTNDVPNDEKETPKTQVAQSDSASATTSAKTPGNLASAFSGAIGSYFNNTLDSTISTAIENTKDQLEIESIRKLAGIMHQNIDRGVVNTAFTFEQGGRFIGAAEIIGGDQIAQILNGAQMKINTEPESAHLRDKVFLNSSSFEKFRISKILLPLKNIDKNNMIPKSLQEETLHIYIALKEDRVCFAAGLTPQVLDDLKNAILQLKKTGPLPRTTFVFSAYELAMLLEPYADELPNSMAPQIISSAIKSGPDAVLTYEVAYSPTIYFSVLRVPQALWSATKIGKLPGFKPRKWLRF
ncbi:MAG: hypothetical protein ACRC2T_02285 [Thermoguttaceae bacterium]